MGLFRNSPTKEFEDKFVNMWNLLSKFSYEQPVSAVEVMQSQIDASFEQLKTIARTFPDLFNVHFNINTDIHYHTPILIFGIL